MDQVWKLFIFTTVFWGEKIKNYFFFSVFWWWGEHKKTLFSRPFLGGEKIKSTFVLHIAWPFAKCNILEFCLDEIAFLTKVWGAVCNIHTFVDKIDFVEKEL